MLEKARTIAQRIWELFFPEGIDPWGILDNKEKSLGEKVEALYVCGRGFLLAFFTKHTKGERLQEGFLSSLFFPPSFETLGGLL